MSTEASVILEPTGTRDLNRAARLDRWFQVPMLIAALLVIPVIVIEQTHATHTVKTLGDALNWLIWIAFGTELVTMLLVTPERMKWLRAHPLEAAIVVLTPPLLPASLQALRLFRLLRVFRLTVVVKEYRRLFSLEGLRGAAVITLVAALGGGALFSEFEHGYSVWDGVWWAITTMTTVGYGDIAPHTVAGRLLAIVLMLIGIGFVALLTGALAQRFLAAPLSESAHAVETEVALEIGTAQAQLANELREIMRRLQELERIVERLGEER